MLVCGVDIGTTNLKVSLVDETGVSRWTRATSTPRSEDDGGAVDASQIVSSIEELVIEGWRTVGQGIALSAIATTGVGEDGIFVNDALAPLGLAIPWYDRRAFAEAGEIRSSPAASTQTGIEMDHTRTAAKWLWLSRNRPELFERQALWIALTDYPSAIWTSRPFMSETLASRTGCYDIGKRAWLSDLVKYCGSPRLPEVLRAGEVVGTMRGGRLTSEGAANKNTLVVAGGHDHPVAAAMIQKIDPLARVDSIGTANVVYGETASFPLDRFDPQIAFMVPVRAKQGVACLGVFEFSSAVRSLNAKGIDIRAVLDLKRIPGEPKAYLSADNLPSTPDPRAVLEVAGISARRMLEHMRLVGVPESDIYATGGWSRSTSLLELRASIFGRPLKVLSLQEPAVVGAALLAAEGLGEVVDFAEGVTTHTVDPDPQWAAIYDHEYENFYDTSTSRAG